MRTCGLVILDGWGCSTVTAHNAIALARTPHWDSLLSQHPHTLIKTHGEAVGLPEGQMGNSEVGHMHLGAGRVIRQNFSRINSAIDTGDFNKTAVLQQALQQALQHNRAVHIIGLLSTGGVHSHQNHIFAALKAVHQMGIARCYVHAITDGRDCPPRSSMDSADALEQALQESGAQLASVIGRYYAMDRDNRWERVEQAYNLFMHAQAAHKTGSFEAAVAAAYARDESDEFIEATAIGDGAVMQEGDVVLFMNYRSDRMREIVSALAAPDFKGFERHQQVPIYAVTLTQYHELYPYPVIFPPQRITNTLGHCISKAGMKQLRIAETEKYPHVTFFLNGGVEQPFEGEERQLIPSPKVATYDLQPQMSLPEVTDCLIACIKSRQYGVFIANFANPDMVGHSGDLTATIAAIEACDAALGRVLGALKQTDDLLICADHGNAEQMFDAQTGGAHTAHTTSLVPLVYVGENSVTLRDGGSLIDVAPTLLALCNISKPTEMTGSSLLEYS